MQEPEEPDLKHAQRVRADRAVNDILVKHQISENELLEAHAVTRTEWDQMFEDFTKDDILKISLMTNAEPDWIQYGRVPEQPTLIDDVA